MGSITELQDRLLERLPELLDHDKVCFHLFNDQDVGEDHEQFWRQALTIYCLERGVLSACFGDMYRDFTIPYVVPGENRGPFGFGGPQSEDVTVKVYPESLEPCLLKLRKANDVLAGEDVRMTSASAPAAEGGGGGWFSSVLNHLSPIKNSNESSDTALASDVHFVPAALLQEMASIVLHGAQKVEGGSSSRSVYYIDNEEATKAHERSLGESDEDLRTGPLTISSLLRSVAKSLDEAGAGAGKEGKEGGHTTAGALYRRLLQGAEASEGGIVFAEALITYMVSRKLAVLSPDGKAVKIAPPSAERASLSSLSSSGPISAPGKGEGKSGAQLAPVFEARDAAILSTQYTLLSLRFLARDTEGKIATKTDKARQFVRRAEEARKSGNSSMESSLTRQAKTQLALRGQLQQQYDSATGALLKLEGALLTLEGQEVQQRVLDSIHNATSTLRTLRESQELSVDRAEQVLEACDEELQEGRALQDDLHALMTESAEEAMQQGGEEEAEAELEALMRGATIGVGPSAGTGTSTSGAGADTLPAVPSHVPAAAAPAAEEEEEATPSAA